MRNCVSYRLPCGVRRAVISVVCTIPTTILTPRSPYVVLFIIQDHKLRILLIRREVVELIT